MDIFRWREWLLCHLFSTENPEHDFPYWLNNIDWNIEIPQILIGYIKHR